MTDIEKLNKLASTQSKWVKKARRRRKWRWLIRIKQRMILKYLVIKDKLK